MALFLCYFLSPESYRDPNLCSFEFTIFAAASFVNYLMTGAGATDLPKTDTGSNVEPMVETEASIDYQKQLKANN